MKEHRILSDGQKCSNSEQNIFQATLALKDRIASLRHHHRAGKLISFDLDHAFDRVRHSFLFGTMRSLGINEDLIVLLSLIASRSTSRLLINGRLSRPFEIQRSVRQGDPLSMHLFVLYLHPLVYRLERVCANDLLVAYADDISVIVTSTRQIDQMNGLFLRFERAAGAKLNVLKTVAIDVGFCEGSTINTQWLQTVNTVKILGVVFANSIRLMTTLNWNAQVGKFSQLMWLQSLRTLTLHQRVTMLNTFATSRIWYLASILPPFCVHTAQITSTMGTFLWRGMVARVPMMQLARSRENGGLKLQLPALKSNSRPAISIDLPDLKLILSNISQIPHQIQQNPSADQIHQHFILQTELPRVERNSPANDWPRAWRNIASRRLTSAQKSELYLFVNEKTPHRKLLFVMRRANDENCTFCDNGETESLTHKFCTCTRVEPAWTQDGGSTNPTCGSNLQNYFQTLAPPPGTSCFALHRDRITSRSPIRCTISHPPVADLGWSRNPGAQVLHSGSSWGFLPVSSYLGLAGENSAKDVNLSEQSSFLRKCSESIDGNGIETIKLLETSTALNVRLLSVPFGVGIQV
ncbi:uncharacterized protein LOC129760127 [Uranotaenia lowii]|uniref:uncharacterized protein LOC129760127 n=1 Tax=Uranotaenia lowii TaxID=190385 RepID=UPI002478BBFE|nr:uncharacterized protein LOC129760127 [Uranotaenia lowii]